MRTCLALLLSISATPSVALDASDFADLVGWTVAAATNVRDEFEGCDFDKKIRFDNGWSLTCSSYSYSYAYRPDAVIFTKSFPSRGQNYWMIKVLINDEIYDMQPIKAK